MSVAAYISEYNTKLDKRISDLNAKVDANDNSGALSVLKSIKESEPESAIAKAYDNNGILIESSLKNAAQIQDKNLARRLDNIHKYKARLEKANLDKSKDHNKELNDSYNRFVNEIGAEPSALGGKSQIDDVLDGDPNDFEELFDDDSLVSAATIQAAFKELRSNTSAVTDDTEESESGAINADVEIEGDEEEEELPSEESSAETGVSSEPITIPEENAEPVTSESTTPIVEPEAETSVVSETSNITNVINEAPPIEATKTSTPDDVSTTSPINTEIEKKKNGGLKGFLNKAKEKLQVLSETGDLTQIFKKSDDSTTNEGASSAINSSSKYNEWGNPIQNDAETAIDNSAINDTSSIVNKSSNETNSSDVSNESTTVNSEISSPSSTNTESTEVSKVSNISAPGVVKLGPTPEPATSDNIKNLGDTITSVNTQQAATPAVIDNTGNLTPSKTKEAPATSTTPNESAPSTGASNAGMASAISEMAKELRSIKSLLAGTLDVKIKGR